MLRKKSTQPSISQSRSRFLSRLRRHLLSPRRRHRSSPVCQIEVAASLRHAPLLLHPCHAAHGAPRSRARPHLAVRGRVVVLAPLGPHLMDRREGEGTSGFTPALSHAAATSPSLQPNRAANAMSNQEGDPRRRSTKKQKDHREGPRSAPPSLTRSPT